MQTAASPDGAGFAGAWRKTAVKKSFACLVRAMAVPLFLAGVSLMSAGCASSPSGPGRTPGGPENWGKRKSVSYERLRKEFRDPDMIYAPFIFWFWDEPLDPAKMAGMSRVMCGQRFNPGYAHARVSMVKTPDLPGGEWLGDKWFAAFDAALKEAEARKNYLGYCDEYWWPSLRANGRVLEANPDLRAESLRWDVFDIGGGAEIRVPASFFAVAARREHPLPSGSGKNPVVKMGRFIRHPGATETPHAVWFRKSFDLPAGRGAGKAAVKMIVDDAFVLYVNGRKIGEGRDWRKVHAHDVSAALVPGKNVIAVEARNFEGPFSLLAGLSVVTADGSETGAVSDRTWRTSLDFSEGWMLPGFDDGGWQTALESTEAPGLWGGMVDRSDHAPAVIRSGTLRIIGAGEPFSWKAPDEGAWRVYVFNKYFHKGVDGSDVNYLDSRLAPAFIQIALEPYAERFGPRLGRSIPGDFIDNEGDYGWNLAWSATLEERCRERYGRDIRVWMPLAVDRDAEGVFARARWEWFDLVSDIYADTFRSLTDWHERRGMYTTAHFWEEGIQPQLSGVGDHMKLLRALTMPGQDCLGRKALRVHDFKEIQSVAEFQDSRAVTELMGAAGMEGTPWGTFNPPFLKQAVNAATAWGMSHIIPHGVFTVRKLTGNPWPPDWYDENPIFPYLHLWNDFARRASFINSMGRAVPDVLLYNPMESAWMQADADILDIEMWSFSESHPGGKRINEIDRIYARAIDDLTAARVEFLVGDRHYLGQMEVEGGKLARGDFEFRALVLPALDILSLETAAKIVDFVKSGGRVYALAELPSASSEAGTGDPRMKELMDALRAHPGFTACGESGLKTALEGPAPGLEGPVRFVSGEFPVLQNRRRIDGRDFFWLANNSGDWRSCEVEIRGVRGAASIWDCETGGIRGVSSTAGAAGSRLSLVFKPYEAYWLVFNPEQAAGSGPPERRPEVETLAFIEGPWEIVCDPALQPVMEYPMAPPPEFILGVEKPLEDWKAWGLEKFSGRMEYDKSVTVGKAAKDIRLDLGKVCHAAEVWVNGRHCGARLWGPYEFDIGRALHEGANRIRIRISNLINNSYGDPAESGLLGPVRLVRIRPVAAE